ncbi:hypothetical protein A471_10323 [Ectopseudomonas mendocina DLHK]|nr:hypothetical protein A471_10323 [Pseudomonas mendocina DLHK]
MRGRHSALHEGGYSCCCAIDTNRAHEHKATNTSHRRLPGKHDRKIEIDRSKARQWITSLINQLMSPPRQMNHTVNSLKRPAQQTNISQFSMKEVQRDGWLTTAYRPERMPLL